MTQLRWVAPRLALKYQTRVEVIDIGKHFSLLRYGKNYCCKKFYSTGRRGIGVFKYIVSVKTSEDLLIGFDILLLWRLYVGKSEMPSFLCFQLLMYGEASWAMFVPSKPFQPSLIFVGKAKSLPWSRAPTRCFNHVGSGLALKYQTKLERNSRDKHSRLLRTFVNYGRKTPWLLITAVKRSIVQAHRQRTSF